MFKTLKKIEDLAVGDTTISVRYFETRTLLGKKRFSAELRLGPGNKIILDDDSLANLETRVVCVAPATIYSRMLAAGAI